MDSPGINLDPDPDDSFRFYDIIHTNCKAEVDENDILKYLKPAYQFFLCRWQESTEGRHLRRCIEGCENNRSVRRYETVPVDAFVGSTISDAFDEAGLNSGYIVKTSTSGDQNVGSALDGIIGLILLYMINRNGMELTQTTYTSTDIPPMSLFRKWIIVPGPIIPVNIGGENIQICWFQNPKIMMGCCGQTKLET